MKRLNIVKLSLVLLSLAIMALATAQGMAQCTQLVGGLRAPLGTAMTPLGNLLVSEGGTGVPGSGRISIVDPSGDRRTLLDGLPSGLSDVHEPSGPNGIFMSGRTLYVAMGVGDVGVAGPCRTSDVPNPAGPSSMASQWVGMWPSHPLSSILRFTKGP